MNYDRNIKQYWDAHVRECDREAGEQAYRAYNTMMHRICEKYGTDLVRTVEAFAALSPANDYLGNLRSLVSLIEGVQSAEPYTVSTFKACGARAESYLSGEVDFLSTVKGRKITAFRNCILDPDGCLDFVLDGHMIAIVLGRPLTMKEANLQLRAHGYDLLANAYLAFARSFGETPSSVQATFWYCRKRTEGIKFSVQRDFWRDDARLLYPIDEILAYRKPNAIA